MVAHGDGLTAARRCLNSGAAQVVMTCRALDIDPQVYLTRTLQDLARWDGSEAQIEAWTPMRWKERGIDIVSANEHREHIGKALAAAVANVARPKPTTG